MGRYSFDAQMAALAHFGAGLAGKQSQASYVETPYLQKVDGKGLGKEREVDLFFAQEKARRVNWNRTHKK